MFTLHLKKTKCSQKRIASTGDFKGNGIKPADSERELGVCEFCGKAVGKTHTSTACINRVRKLSDSRLDVYKLPSIDDEQDSIDDVDNEQDSIDDVDNEQDSIDHVDNEQVQFLPTPTTAGTWWSTVFNGINSVW